jgi:hypothetical protein
MKYPIDSAIAEFDKMVQIVAPRATQQPDYIAVKDGWPAYLNYLEPLISGKHFYSSGGLDYALPRFQKDETSIEDENADERAIYFGVMASSTLTIAKRRDNYLQIDFEELAGLWRTEFLHPMESLKGRGFFEAVSSKGLDLLVEGFLRLHVQPLVRTPQKLARAISYFKTQFFSGILLHQIVTFLILRDHYKRIGQKP